MKRNPMQAAFYVAEKLALLAVIFAGVAGYMAALGGWWMALATAVIIADGFLLAESSDWFRRWKARCMAFDRGELELDGTEGKSA